MKRRTGMLENKSNLEKTKGAGRRAIVAAVLMAAVAKSTMM